MTRASVPGSLVIAAKLVCLAVLLFAILALSAAALDIRAVVDADTAAAQQGSMALVVLGVCFLQAVALAPVILLSRWSGWRLVLTVFGIGFAMSAVLPQLESLVFLPQMSRALIGRVVLSSAVTWAVFSPLAVWLLGRARRGYTDPSRPPRISRSIVAWSVVLLALAALHLALYLVFGYYVAWRSPGLAGFYGGEDPGSLALQIRGIARNAPWFYPFQFARGLLWSLLAVPVALMIARSRLTAALAAAALFGILMPSQLLFPNPYLPDVVRWAHFGETLFSRLLFGFAAVGLLRIVVVIDERPGKSRRDLIDGERLRETTDAARCGNPDAVKRGGVRGWTGRARR